MLFNSWGYLLFLALLVPLHWLLPVRFRMALLAGASIAFYAAWRWDFSLLVVFSAAVDYLAAQRIHAGATDAVRKRWLLVSLTVNLGLLVFFKYTYFLHDNVARLLILGGIDLPELGFGILLPLGISFYTFQTISYSIDVYRRVAAPVDGFLPFLTYVTFWPQLIAGPILRVGEVVPQLLARRRLRSGDLAAGLEQVVIGLFKKVVLADNIAPLVDTAFALEPASMTAFDVWVATFLFGFQIYFDFSGYSDVAIGSARMLGIAFPANFDWPYLARSPKDFWRRWHISLSSWIRDYVYLPLTGEPFRKVSTGGIATATRAGGGAARTRALFTTWLIMGLWHGAGWTFALWGLYHATLVWLDRRLGVFVRLERHLPVVGWGLMLLLSMASWILFRAQSVDQALQMLGALVDPTRYVPSPRALGVSRHYAAAAALLVGMLAVRGVAHWVRGRSAQVRVWLTNAQVVTVATMVLLIWLYLRPVRQFIYFQF